MSEALQHEIRHLHEMEGSPRDPDGRAFLPLADAYLRAGDHDRAEQLLVDGLDRHPDFVAAHVLAAHLREAQGNVDGAELAWAAARRLDPENVEVLYGLGRIMAGRGEEIGVTLVERARALDPTAGQATPRASVAPAASPATIPEADADADVVPITELAPSGELSGWEDPEGVHDLDVVSIADLAPDVAVPDTVADDDASTHLLAADPAIAAVADAPATAEEAPAVDDEADVVSIAELAPDAESPPAAEGGVAEDEAAQSDATQEHEEEQVEEGIMPISELTPRPEQPSSDPGERRVVTRTLAELLVAQGQHGAALEMYETLAARHPGDEDLQARLDGLRAGGEQKPNKVAHADGGAHEDPEDEDLHHHPSAPDPVPDAPTPFAWTETGDGDSDGESEAEATNGPGVSGFFDGLLSWTPTPSPDGDA